MKARETALRMNDALVPLGTAALMLTVVLLAAAPVEAAVGCSLNDPDRDVIRLFPAATGYRTEYISIAGSGGDSLAARVEHALGDKLDPVFEALDVDYTYYTVLDGTETIGRVHGVNQKGMYGGMQLILATDLSGAITSFYYQKMSSPESKLFRNEAFTSAFVGLTLGDVLPLWAAHRDDTTDSLPGPLTRVVDPSGESADDFRATLRGIAKNMLLLHEFFGTETERPNNTEGGAR